MGRSISMRTNIDTSRFRNGNINEEHYNKIRQLRNEAFNNLPLYIYDSAAASITAICSKARKLKRKNNLSILFIDYLQLIRGTKKGDNRYLEVTEITQSLKALAKELDIPIIALSQLSRAVEQRTDKKPFLSDLRESGSIEQDADIVMFIYREEYYLKGREPYSKHSREYADWVEKMEKARDIAEIIVAKHRHGETGNIKLYYDKNYCQFFNLAPDVKV
jgi:replicative DNA helicase